MYLWGSQIELFCLEETLEQQRCGVNAQTSISLKVLYIQYPLDFLLICIQQNMNV
jgi:hypothetical protein